METGGKITKNSHNTMTKQQEKEWFPNKDVELIREMAELHTDKTKSGTRPGRSRANELNALADREEVCPHCNK